MKKKLSWELFSNENRNEVIEAVKNVISNCDGCIINSTMFSDLALALSIEIEENRIIELYDALSKIAKVSEFDKNEINIKSVKDWFIFMNISFARGKGELKKVIPAVP